MWVTDENNRRIIGMLGENNRGNFLELQNRIIGKLKSMLGSGLIFNGHHTSLYYAKGHYNKSRQE